MDAAERKQLADQDAQGSTDFGSFDYIIAGGGTAGCVLANRLSANPDVSVLLLEAGGKDDWIWIHIPVGYLYCIGNQRTDWCYRTEPEPGLNGRSILYARGKVLGGSSSINAMLCLRGQARDYDEWASITGDSRWNWQNVLPVFKASEDYWRGADAMHAVGGPWRVEKQRLHWDVLDRFALAANEAGIAFCTDFNRGNNEGVGLFEVNQKRGVRWSAAKGYLRPALKRPNLKVVTNALIDRVLLKDKVAYGVSFSLGEAADAAGSASTTRQRYHAHARIETLLTAGAIGSPAILQRSGIGPAPLLEAQGVPVVHALKGVGRNLQDHLQLRMIFKVEGVVTLNQRANSLWGKMLMGLEYALNRSGPLSMAPSQMGGFTKSSTTVATPDLEYHVQPLSLDKFGDPLHPFPAFTVSICNLRPTSRGRIEIRDRIAATPPVIAPNYLNSENDRQIAAASLRLTRHILAQPALASLNPQEHLPGAKYASDAELIHAAGDIGTTIFHPVGTCAMGRADDENAVVDCELRVRGIQRLRVIDASIMPTITSGNTNTPTLMIAERGAALVLGAWKR